MNHRIRKFSYLSLLATIEIVVGFVPFLGFIPLGIIDVTTMHLPVIMTGILLGKGSGMIVGFVFGLISMIKATMSPGPTSFLFSPFYSINGISGAIASLVIAFVPRILIGYVSGFIYELLKNKHENMAVIISSIAGSMTNTILVMSLIYIFFKDAYASVMSIAVEAVVTFIISVIMTNGILEAVTAAVTVIIVYKATKRFVRL